MVEKARQKQRIRHGGEFRRVELDPENASVQAIPDDLLALDEALQRLEQLNPDRANIVKLRFFAGLTIPEAAKAMNISIATAERYWTFSRTWLFAKVYGDSSK